jgi:conjugal transfer pilus assembly protein TraE
MTGARYLSLLDQLQSKNRLLVIALALMLAFNLMNWWSLQRAKSQLQTIVVPIGGGTGMKVGNGKASAEYLRHMARYITGMLGSYTAATARPQLQELLTLFAPEVAGAAQVEFERLIGQIERFPSISSVVRWEGEQPLKSGDGLLQIKAAKDQLVGGNVSETRSLHYCIRYRIDDARFWILSIREREGTAADLCFLPDDAGLSSKETKNEPPDTLGRDPLLVAPRR